MKCECCDKDHDGDYGSGRFCCQSCSRRYSTNLNKETTRLKIKESINKLYDSRTDVECRIERLCLVCGRKFKNKRKIITCSLECGVAYRTSSEKLDSNKKNSKYFGMYVYENDFISNHINLLKTLYPSLDNIRWIRPSNGRFTSRLICTLLFPNTLRKVTQVSKLILEATVGRVLSDDETCDHIDGDSMNNNVSNLQILSLSANASKGSSDLIKSKVRNYNSKILSNRPENSGENSCLHKLTEKQVLEIKEIQKNYYSGQDKVLSEKYNVTDKTIENIRFGKTWKLI